MPTQSTGVATTRRFIRENPDIVRKYVKAQVEAVHRIKADRETGMRVLVNEPHADMPFIRGYLTKQFGKAAQIDPESGILRACQVADGLADMAVVCANKRQGRTCWWDVAPGHAIVASAGGRVETLDGQPLRYESSDLRVPPHILLSPLRARPAAPPMTTAKPSGSCCRPCRRAGPPATSTRLRRCLPRSGSAAVHS